MSGTFVSLVFWIKSAAAMSGRVAFLDPEIVTSQETDDGPEIESKAID